MGAFPWPWKVAKLRPILATFLKMWPILVSFYAFVLDFGLENVTKFGLNCATFYGNENAPYAWNFWFFWAEFFRRFFLLLPPPFLLFHPFFLLLPASSFSLLPSQSCPLSPSSFLLSCSSFLFSLFCLLLLFRSFKCDALILPSVLKIVTKIGLEKRDWKETCLRDHFWTKIFTSTVCDGRFAYFFDFKTWPKSASLPNPTKRSLQNQWWRTKRIRFRNS